MVASIFKRFILFLYTSPYLIDGFEVTNTNSYLGQISFLINFKIGF